MYTMVPATALPVIILSLPFYAALVQKMLLLSFFFFKFCVHLKKRNLSGD